MITLADVDYMDKNALEVRTFGACLHCWLTARNAVNECLGLLATANPASCFVDQDCADQCYLLPL